MGGSPSKPLIVDDEFLKSCKTLAESCSSTYTISPVEYVKHFAQRVPPRVVFLPSPLFSAHKIVKQLVLSDTTGPTEALPFCMSNGVYTRETPATDYSESAAPDCALVDSICAFYASTSQHAFSTLEEALAAQFLADSTLRCEQMTALLFIKTPGFVVNSVEEYNLIRHTHIPSVVDMCNTALLKRLDTNDDSYDNVDPYMEDRRQGPPRSSEYSSVVAPDPLLLNAPAKEAFFSSKAHSSPQCEVFVSDAELAAKLCSDMGIATRGCHNRALNNASRTEGILLMQLYPRIDATLYVSVTLSPLCAGVVMAFVLEHIRVIMGPKYSEEIGVQVVNRVALMLERLAKFSTERCCKRYNFLHVHVDVIPLIGPLSISIAQQSGSLSVLVENMLMLLGVFRLVRLAVAQKLLVMCGLKKRILLPSVTNNGHIYTFGDDQCSTFVRVQEGCAHQVKEAALKDSSLVLACFDLNEFTREMDRRFKAMFPTSEKGLQVSTLANILLLNARLKQCFSLFPLAP